jgi:hypothetical protein
MSQEQDVQRLLREGIEKARAGDKTAARELFEQVVELDENNERGWYWLASVVDTDEERRVCLSNVMVINPNNEKARKLMEKLQARKREEEAEKEVIPGVSRRQLLLIVGGGGALVAVLVLFVVAALVISENNRQAQLAEQTRVAQELTATQLLIEATATAEQATLIAQAEPTSTPLLVGTLPPTFTPTVTEVAPEAQVGLPLPPGAVSGLLAAWGGRDLLGLGDRALEIYTIPVNTGELRQVGSNYGREVRFGDSAQRVIYTRYFSPTFSFGIESVNTNGTQSVITQDRDTVFTLTQPDRCRARGWVTLVGVPVRPLTIESLQLEEPPRQIFILDRDTDNIRPVTNDDAIYSDPAFSPDCSQIVAVRDDVSSANPGPDVVLIDIATSGIRPLTSDLDSYVESKPRWSPDGTQIIFAAAPATDPTNHDIFVMNADGSGVPLPVVRSPGDDILPVFSPDGRYVAFSSNRSGVYNIYVISPTDNALYQVTNSINEGNFYVGDWWQ